MVTTLTNAGRAVLVSAMLLSACGDDGSTGTAIDDTITTAPSTAPSSHVPTVPDPSSPAVSDQPDASGEVADETVVVDGDVSGEVADDPAEPVTGEVPQAIVDDLIERVSVESGVDRDDIVVVRAFSKVWSDGSLGCSEPGMVYQQLEVVGHQIELEANGESWDFRVGTDGEVIHCEPGS